ncbi:MAG: tripartite tricarboxylate transporter TctB family protein [Xanthobacteraceae bacterium]|nr:tripartite tricarboxylate transporter TctB family protein [Xanthobacteraceae bacterium]
MDEARKPDRAAIAIAVFLLVVAAVTAWDASVLQLAPTYGLGPKMMAYVVAAGMAIIAAANLVLAWRGDFPERESYDPKAIVLILGGFAALIAIIAFGGGFIPATAVLFAATAAAFGRKAVITDLAIGAVLGLAVYLLFDKLLTLSLPAGPIERLF